MHLYSVMTILQLMNHWRSGGSSIDWPNWSNRSIRELADHD